MHSKPNQAFKKVHSKMLVIRLGSFLLCIKKDRQVAPTLQYSYVLTHLNSQLERLEKKNIQQKVHHSLSNIAQNGKGQNVA